MISFWSIFSATLWFGMAFLLLYALRRQTHFLMYHGVTVLSAMVVLTVIRLLLPFDSGHMIVLRSYRVLPVLDKVLLYELIGTCSVESFLKWLWLFGALLGGVFIIRGILRDRRRLGRLSTVPMSLEMQEAVKKSGIDVDKVHIASDISTPMVTGFLHPAICLPVRDYPEDDLLWILKHERSHIEGYDAWLRLGFLLFRCLFWWNPFVHAAQKLVDDILELRCDEAVLSKANATERVEYVEALYHAASQSCSQASSFIGAGTFVQPKRADILAVRAKVAIEEPRSHNRNALMILTLSLVLFGVSYVFIPQPAGFPPEMDDGVNIYAVSPETSYLRKTPSGEYELWCNGEYAGSVSIKALNDELYKNLEVHYED